MCVCEYIYSDVDVLSISFVGGWPPHIGCGWCYALSHLHVSIVHSGSFVYGLGMEYVGRAPDVAVVLL